MPKSPLPFDLPGVVEGDGFLAVLRMRGRVTGMEGFGSYRIYGVNPGGLARTGRTWRRRGRTFRRAVMEVLFDLADRASDFAGFRDAVRSFLAGPDDDITEERVEARRRIRAGPIPEAGLRADTAELDTGLEIRNILDPASGPEPRLDVLSAPEESLAA